MILIPTMSIQRYSKPRLFFLGILISYTPIILVARSEHKDPFTGTWKYIKEDIDLYPANGDYRPSSYQRKKEPLYKELQIRKIGKHEVYYYVIPDGRKGFVFKQLNDTILYEKSGNDTTLLLYHPRDQTLQFSTEKHNIIGVHDLYFPKFSRTDYYDIQQTPLTTENFFDFDISNYQSGNIRNFVPGRRLLPFQISHAFISRRKIKNLTIDIRLVEPNHKSYDTSGFKAKLIFDRGGYLQKVSCIFSEGQEHWSFTRRNDSRHSLLKIEFTTSDTTRKSKTYYYDIDEWPVNNDSAKIVDEPVEWQMLDLYVPSKFSLLRSKASAEFKFDGHHYLTDMILFETEKKRGSISFVYDKDGTLTNVNWLEDR